ncbi:MAG: hypothetical protein RI964_2334 [Pseudomonadota bacterium]
MELMELYGTRKQLKAAFHKGFWYYMELMELIIGRDDRI